MALSAQTYQGDGSNRDFVLDFTLGYISESHIHVYVDDVEIPQNTLQFILGGGSVRLPTAPVSGSEVLVRRIVPNDKLLHDYENGSLVIESNLDESNLQSIMLQHEAVDGFSTGIYGDINFFTEISDSTEDTAESPRGVEQVTITGLASLAEEQRDEFESTFNAQFIYKRIGNLTDYSGTVLTEDDKLNSYQYPDDSGNWYAPIQGQAFPYILPIDPTVSDSGMVLTSTVGIYQGLWPDTGGSANKGDTYQTQVSGTGTGQYFTALQNTTAYPVSDDVNWREVVSNKSLGVLTNYQADSVADAVAGITVNGSVNLEVGQRWIIDDYYGGGSPSNSGVLFFKVVAAGTGTADGGKYIDVPGGLFQLEQNLKSPFDIKAWGGKAGVNVSPAVASACAYLATVNSFEKSKGLYFPGEIYLWENQVNLDISHGNMSWFSDGNCTFDIRNLASEHPLVVDYSTGGTANFLKFDMENIHWSDTSLSYSRRGPHFKRVIGSSWKNCHFNYFAIPLAMDENTNLNVIENAQFRGNAGRIVGYTGGANNNTWINPQFRYNTATVFKALGDASFPGNFLENKFIGGDIEPTNASPCFDITSTYIQGMRCERNSADVQFLMGDNNTLVDISIHSDGGTQAIGAEVTGRGNDIHFKYFSGQRAINFTNTAIDNTYEITNSVMMSAGGGTLVYDLGDRNISRVNGVAQTDSLYSLPMRKGYTVPRDLSLWSVVGGTLTYKSEDDSWEFISNGSSSDAYIYTQVPVDQVTDFIAGFTVDPANLGGQCSAYLNTSPSFDGNEIGIGGYNDTDLPPVRVYAQRNNYSEAATALDEPYIMIKTAASSGGSVRIKDVVVSTTAYLPSL